MLKCITLWQKEAKENEKRKEQTKMAKDTGMKRRIDELGRIVIPKGMRTALNINDNDELEIYLEGDRIIIRKAEQSCSICGSKENLVELHKKHICMHMTFTPVNTDRAESRTFHIRLQLQRSLPHLDSIRTPFVPRSFTIL